MAGNEVRHLNEGGLALKARERLETHHPSKAVERVQLIRDLPLKKGGLVVDAGDGPGLWTRRLVKAIGLLGHVLQSVWIPSCDVFELQEYCYVNTGLLA